VFLVSFSFDISVAIIASLSFKCILKDLTKKITKAPSKKAIIINTTIAN
jgi:hypothetical protein